MTRYLLVLFIVLCSFSVKGQTISIAGTVKDTTAKAPLQNAVAMVVRVRDSVMVAHTRTDKNGVFKFTGLQIDTFQVLLTHPHFGDKSFFIVGSKDNKDFNFGTIAMPNKSLSLKEVVIYAAKDPVYYKGDTMVFVADSFKVKPNAVVEDLLKKLPGMRVDAKGAITSQGKKIDQVLVDGDEFFGSDPTVATKNLNANTVESVQVYEKKNDNAGATGAETLQVLNLKLKDEAKKGYFGKVSGASDFNKFYETELLANKFKGKQKISVFAINSNTPRASIGFDDSYKYGLSDETNSFQGEDGETTYYFNSNSSEGIPKTLKSGIYYSDKLGKNTKLNLNYSYGNKSIKTEGSTNSQYFLADTTYSTKASTLTDQTTSSHSLNLGVVQTIDSLTELEVTSKLKYNENQQNSINNTSFYTRQDSLSRSTRVENNQMGKSLDWANFLHLTHRFKKKDRKAQLTYNLNITSNESNGILKSDNTYVLTNPVPVPTDHINQRKTSTSFNQSHTIGGIYTEPITKKIKLEASYDLNFVFGHQDKIAKDFANGDYTATNNLYTNDFENKRYINRVGGKFIYETKKTRLNTGAYARQLYVESANLVGNTSVNQTVNAVLPFLTYRYSIEDNSSIRFEYKTNSREPSLNQLQPVPDNSNPNFIRIGNSKLLPSYTHNFNLSYNTYKPLSQRYVYSNVYFGQTLHGFSDSTNYSSIGQTRTKTVNVEGNYNGGFYAGGGLPFFSHVLELDPNANYSISNTNGFINGQKNSTLTNSAGAGLDLNLKLEKLEFSIGTSYDYTAPKATINSENNKPYSSESYTARFRWELPKKFTIESDASYNTFSKRAAGYNKSYLLLDASIGKAFMKSENLIVKIDATDLLNQNVSNTRTVANNVITDSRTTLIGRYILLKVVYKFNSNKGKEEDEE